MNLKEQKKVACIILGTSKNVDRLMVLMAGAVRSQRHSVYMIFVSDGPRPDFLPPDWQWISADHLKIKNPGSHPTSRRHAWALESKIASTEYDYCLFFDDDVIVDVDRFCEFAEQEEHIPACWLVSPGLYMHQWSHPRAITEKYFPCEHLNDIFISGVMAAVNKKFIELADSNRTLWEGKLQDWADDFGTPDVAICVLAGLLKAKVIRGEDQIEFGGTGWPAMVCSSVLCNTGQRWFIHGTFRTDLTNTDSLRFALSQAPMDIEMLIPTLYFQLQSGFKAKDFLDKSLTLMFFWLPSHMAGQSGSRTGHDVVVRKIQICGDGMVYERGTEMHKIGTWSACSQGMSLNIDGSGVHTGVFMFKWTLEGQPVGYPVSTVGINYFGHLYQLRCE